MEQTELSYRARPELVRHVVAKHQSWMEEQLGTSLEQCIAIEVAQDLSDVGAACILHCGQYQDNTELSVRRLQSRILKACTPPGLMPRVQLRSVVEDITYQSLQEALDADSVPRRVEKPVLSWQDCPISLHIRGLHFPVIVCRVNFIDGPDMGGTSTANVLIARRESASQLVDLLAELTRPQRIPTLVTLHGGQQVVPPYEWDKMVLDPAVTNLLKDDIDFFFQSADWFRKMGLPHRRGYLLHGPPGNGKSTAVRCLLTSHGLTAYTLRLFDKGTDDESLDELFRLALKTSPSVVLFEDIDRAFPKTGEYRTRISVQHLLNTLDGIASGEEIIVVATANEPALLDPAILRRPGRFDRVVQFPNPSEALRKLYFERLDLQITTAQLSSVGQQAFGRHGEITGGDLLYGVVALRVAYRSSTRQQNAAGFQPASKALAS
jgi:hypothetical protein